MTQTLRQLISTEAFSVLWPHDPPDYDGFIDALANRLSGCLPVDADHVQLSYKLVSANRVRIDGRCHSDSEPLAFWSEIVWLPKFRSFRGEAHTRRVPSPTEPKTLDDFVIALRNISEDADLIVSAQAYSAAQGLELDDSSELTEESIAAIFEVFERFPDEDFSCLTVLLKPSEHLANRAIGSLRQRPSLGVIELLAALLHVKENLDNYSSVFQGLREIADSSQWEQYIRDAAQHSLTRLSK
jgi:hypothetical protein